MSIIIICVVIVIICFLIYIYNVPEKTVPPGIITNDDINMLYNKGVDDINTLKSAVISIDHSKTRPTYNDAILFTLAQDKVLNKDLVNELNNKYISNSLLIALLNKNNNIITNEPIEIAEWQEFAFTFSDARQCTKDDPCNMLLDYDKTDKPELGWKLELIPISFTINKISSLQLQYTYTYNSSSNNDIILKNIVLKSNTINIDSKYKYISIAYCNTNNISLIDKILQNGDKKQPMKILFNFTINKVNLYTEMNIIKINNIMMNKKLVTSYPNDTINFFWQRRSYSCNYANNKKLFTLAYNGNKNTEYFNNTIVPIVSNVSAGNNITIGSKYPSLYLEGLSLMGTIVFPKSKLPLVYVKYTNNLLSQKGINSVMDSFEEDSHEEDPDEPNDYESTTTSLSF